MKLIPRLPTGSKEEEWNRDMKTVLGAWKSTKDDREG